MTSSKLTRARNILLNEQAELAMARKMLRTCYSNYLRDHITELEERVKRAIDMVFDAQNG